MHDTIGWLLDFPVFAERHYTPDEWREKCAEIEAYLLEEIDKK